AIAEHNPPLLAEPGTIFSYCNEGFGLLTRVIELASGTDYVTYVTDNILKPLGMTRSVFHPDALAELPDVSNLYSYIDGYERVEETPGYYWAPSLIGTGYLRSTTGDLARYAAVHNGTNDVEVLAPELVSRMSEPVVEVSPGVHYGYGLTIRGTQHGERVIHHGGSTKGVGAHLALVPEHAVTSVVLTNITGCPVAEFAFKGVNTALGLPLETPILRHEPVEVDTTARESYAGTFSSEEFEKVRIELTDDGQLLAHTGTTTAPATTIKGNALTFERNGSTVLLQYLEPADGGGYRTVRFGSRVLGREEG
ncbi:MAG TPA: serine hydrolase, partial [Deinococcales bacterium]|nr:serine hydrolase [Deinococcales bacterium]